MAKGRVGLDVGSTAVRAAEVAYGTDPPQLVRASQVPLPPGVVRQGEVRDVAAVTEAVRELWRRGGFKSKQVTMGVGNQRVVVREVTVPALAPKELRQSLPYQVEQLIPIPVDEAILDYDVLSEHEEEGQRMLRLLVVAAQREMIGELVRTVTQAKLEPVGIDLVPFALIRAVGQDEGLGLEETDRGLEAIVDIGADVTNICIHERGVARFVRILPSGGAQISTAIADSLGLSPDEAEALKRTPDDGRPEVREILSGRLSALAEEIRSSLDFFRAQTPDGDVTRILVTGGGSKVPGFLDLLHERVGARVQRGHAFGKVDVRLDMDEDTMIDAEPLLAVALGLALPQG